MRYIHVRDLFKVNKWVRLNFAEMNIKKYALHIAWWRAFSFLFTSLFAYIEDEAAISGCLLLFIDMIF